MHLKSLQLNGFKSFALPTSLDFTRGVTAIVGPNGSGKSNVADAARWVLGEMSLKTLRGKKSEDVIFAGSRIRAGHSMAEVTLIFDNADGSLPIDAAEVALTRRLFRNGESQYEINGTQVRLMDIQEVLTKAGLGERSYAVIGQGQVDAILRASPAERKEFFEEAAGVKQFQLKKDQALRKLEITRRNLIRVEDLVGEIAPRLGSLRRQAERAAVREQLEQELRQESIVWFGAELAAIDEQASSDLKALDAATKERAQLEHKITDMEKSHAATEQAALEEERELLANRIAQTATNLTELTAEKNDLKRKQASLEERELPTDVAQLPSQIAELEAQLDGLTRRAATLVPQVETLRSQVAKLEQQSQATAAQIQTLRSALTKQRPARSVDQRELAGLFKQLQDSFEDFIGSIAEAASVELVQQALQRADRPRRFLSEIATRLEQHKPIDSTGLNAELDRVLEARDEILASLAGQREQLGSRETEHRLLSKQIVSDERTLKDLKRQLVAAKKAGAAGAKKVALSSLVEELKEFDQRIATTTEQLRSLEREREELTQRSAEVRVHTREALEAVQATRTQLLSVIERQSTFNVAKGKYDVRREDLLSEARQLLGEKLTQTLSRGGADVLSPDKRETLKHKIELLRKKIEQAGGIDETIMQEYQETKERHDFLVSQSQDLTRASDSLREIIKELDHKIHDRFARSLSEINLEFDRAFKVLFNGGTAKLLPMRAVRKVVPVALTASAETETEDSEDEVTRELERLRNTDGIIGVDIKATPPGKKLQGIGMLSGGEKALTSIALLSAILATKPSPFVILDEVDAALDEANSRRFAKIVKSLSGKTQFITITHNRETMRQASILYGVTMQKDGVSKLLSVKLDAVAQDGSLAKATT